MLSNNSSHVRLPGPHIKGISHICDTYLFHLDVKFTMDLSSSEDLHPACEMRIWIQLLFTARSQNMIVIVKISQDLDSWPPPPNPRYSQYLQASENIPDSCKSDVKCMTETVSSVTSVEENTILFTDTVIMLHAVLTHWQCIRITVMQGVMQHNPRYIKYPLQHCFNLPVWWDLN